MTELIQHLDSSFLLFLQNSVRNPVTDPIMRIFSIAGNIGAIWILFTLFLLIKKKYRSAGIQLALSLIASVIINNLILKNLIQRPRPFNEIQGLTVLFTRFVDASSWSFPSGHAGSSFAAAFSISKSFGKKGYLAYIPAVLISFSRMYIGVHYPSDIICGAIFGTLGALVVYVIISSIHRRKLC